MNNKQNKLKILLIGGTSLIGPHLIKELLSEKYRVATFTRSGKNYLVEDSFEGDRNNKKELKKVIIQYNPQIIIDMIPFTKEQAEILTDIIKKTNISLIALSSIDVYSAYAKINKTENIDYQECPILENNSLRKKLGPEGEKYNKLAVEKVYLQTLKNITILRLPAVYGSPETSRFEHYLTQMLRKEKEIHLSKNHANWRFSRALHKNIAFGILLSVKANQKGRFVYNIAEKKAYSEKEWIEKIANICGWKGIIIGSENIDTDVDLKQDFYVSSQKIRQELGFYEKYNPDEGLEENVFFYVYQNFGKTYKKYY